MTDITTPSSLADFRRMGGLLGFLLKGEVDAIFKQQPFKTASGEDPLELWRRYDQARARLAPVPVAALAPPPDTLSQAVHAITERATFKEYYQSVADYSIAVAPIASLLSPQWYADLDYIDELAAGLSPTDTSEAQLTFALSEGRINQPMVVGNTVLFSSARRDLHADQVPTVRQTAAGQFEIVVRATSRPNYIQVATIDDRLVLTNGVHKVCALHKAGFATCFCVTRHAHDLAEAGINVQSTTIFREQMFKGPRPARAVDFLDHTTTVPLLLRSMHQVLQIGIQSGMLTIPALPKQAT